MAIGEAGLSRVITGFTQGTEWAALIKTDGSEVTGGGYSRVQVNFQRSTEQGATNEAVNAADIDFGTATAAWGTVNRVNVYTSSSGTGASTLVFEGTISNRTVAQNDSFEVPAGQYQIAFT